MLGEMYFVQMKSNIWSKYVRVAVCVNNVSSGQLSHEMLLSYSIAQSSGEGDCWIMNNELSWKKTFFLPGSSKGVNGKMEKQRICDKCMEFPQKLS